MPEHIGIIGVGNMGSFYLQKLLEAGYLVQVYDPRAERQAWAREQGAEVANSPRELVQRCEVVLLAVPGNREVRAIMEEALSVLQRGQVLVNTSTTHPQIDVYYAEGCARAGATWVDAPVTWRPQGLIIMVGGGVEAYQRVLPILQTFAYRVVHVGEAGSGQKLKAVNQLILADQLAVWCEAVEFARGIGLAPELIRDALELPVPDAVLGEEFAGGGQLALHYKDLGYILDLAHEHESAIPLTGLVHEIFKATKRFGGSDWIQPGIVTFWRRLNG